MSGNATLDSQRLHQLLMLSHDGVIFFDHEWCVLDCKTGGFKWLEPSALIGRSIAELFSTPVAERIASSGANAPGGVELILRPESLSIFRSVGLSEHTWVRLRWVYTADGGTLLVQDLSLEKKLSRRESSQAQRDSLTGAYNGKMLRPLLVQAIAQAQRYDWVCSLLLVDVDDFGEINARYSWDGGDKVLQTLVEGLQRLKRTADFLARRHDNQIALYFPETNREQALMAADRILRLVREFDLEYEGDPISFSVSIGIATLEGPSDSPDKMTERAENNLYVAKQSGGDRAEADPVD